MVVILTLAIWALKLKLSWLKATEKEGRENNRAKKHLNLPQVHIRAAGDVRRRGRGGEEKRKLPKTLLARMVRIRLKTEVMMMMGPSLCSAESRSISQLCKFSSPPPARLFYFDNFTNFSRGFFSHLLLRLQKVETCPCSWSTLPTPTPPSLGRTRGRLSKCCTS